jgi:transposase
MQGPPQKPFPSLFQAVDIESLVPRNHLLRRIDKVLDISFVRELTASTYAESGRPSYDPELIARIWVLQDLFGLSERQVCDQVRMNIGFRWFCRLTLEDPVPDQSTLVKLRNHRFDETDLWARMLEATVKAAAAVRRHRPLRMALDGSLVRANAAVSSLEEIGPELEMDEEPPPDDGFEKFFPQALPPALRIEEGGGRSETRRAGDPDFRGEKFTNGTHCSKTDPDALLYRKGNGKEAHLSYIVHNLVDVETGIIHDTCATRATGTAERSAGAELVRNLTHRPQEVLADSGYASGDFLAELESMGVRPIVSIHGKPQPVPKWKRHTNNTKHQQNREQKVRNVTARNNALAAMKTSYAKAAYKERILIERLFAEAKERHGMRKARCTGQKKMDDQAKRTAAAQNLRRLANMRPKADPAGRNRAIAPTPVQTGDLSALRPPYNPSRAAHHLIPLFQREALKRLVNRPQEG